MNKTLSILTAALAIAATDAGADNFEQEGKTVTNTPHLYALLGVGMDAIKIGDATRSQSTLLAGIGYRYKLLSAEAHLGKRQTSVRGLAHWDFSPKFTAFGLLGKTQLKDCIGTGCPKGDGPAGAPNFTHDWNGPRADYKGTATVFGIGTEYRPSGNWGFRAVLERTGSTGGISGATLFHVDFVARSL